MHIFTSVLPIKFVSFRKTGPEANAFFISSAKYFTCGKNITKSLNKDSQDYLSFFIDDNIKPHKPNLYAFIFGGCYLIYQKIQLF